MLKRLVAMWTVGVLTLGGAGCASYSETIRDMEHQLASKNPAAALRLLDDRSAFDRNDVLYYLNKAMFLRMQGDYGASNSAFETAKAQIDARAATSLTEQAGSFVINEGVKSFIGEDFERALIHLYAALNYLQLDKPYEARVEVLQVDLFLQELAKQKSGDPRSYSEDAFCRYLAAMVYENLGEWSDALISYRKAFEAYRRYESLYGIAVPEALQADLLRLTDQQGLSEERDSYAKEFGFSTWQSFDEWKKKGEIVVLLHNGLAPVKQSQVARFPALHSGQIISVALPEYQRRFNPVQKILFEVDAKAVDAAPVQNIEGIAIRSLEDRLPGLTAKAIARATSKYNLTRHSNQQGGELVGLVVNIAGALTEVADTRAWFSLPSQIYMARVSVPPGRYAGTLRILGRGDMQLDLQIVDSIEVKRGKKTFIDRHWVSPQSLYTRGRLSH